MSRPLLRLRPSASQRRGDTLLHLAAPAARARARRRRPRAPRKRHDARPRGAWVRPAIGFLVFVEVLLLGGHAVRWAKSSPRFALKEVVLEGHHTLDPEGIVRLAAFRRGMNIFEADLEGVRRRVEANPWVRRASVRRRLPHYLRIEIEERRPVAVLRRREAVGVDAEGVVLGRLRERPGRCLPLLEGYDAAGLRPGEVIEGPGFRAAIAAASLFAELPGIAEGCLSVRRTGPGRLRLRALGGKVDIWVGEDGLADQAARFRAVARQILQETTSSSARVELDLTFPARIIVRPTGQEGGAKG